MTKDEALRLALEALNDRASLMKWQRAREAVEQALEQPEQKPVAWMNPYGGVIHRRMTGHEKKHYTIPLYTSPPKREWQVLTDEEIDLLEELYAPPVHPDFVNDADHCLELIRHVEAKLKEKNT